MTVENCIVRYKKYVEEGNEEAAEDMKQHILSAKKFKEHPFLQQLQPKPFEAKKSGKKPKG